VNVAPSAGLDELGSLLGGLGGSLRGGLLGGAVEERLGVGRDDGPAVTVAVLPPVSRRLSEAQAASAPAAMTSPAQSTTLLRGT
jgi:hypothetical protein